MHDALPPLNGLRAFEAAARHLSMARAAEELNVTPSALSHQIRGLEAYLGAHLFERKVRAIELTPQGRLLLPGLEAGFAQIREAVAALRMADQPHVLVISTPPGLTAKWLASRLYRFSSAHPEIEVRISSSVQSANFVTDGVDVAIRNLPRDLKPDAALIVEPLVDIEQLPVCTPAFAAEHGPFDGPGALLKAPLIHDDTYRDRSGLPTWADWAKVSGLDEAVGRRGISFSSADHALDAAAEGAGALLTGKLLAHDDLVSGRLILAYPLTLLTPRAYHLVYPKLAADDPTIAALGAWLRAELAAMAEPPGFGPEARRIDWRG